MYRISYRFLVPGWSAKPLVSAHDRIMGTHRVLSNCHEREVRCWAESPLARHVTVFGRSCDIGAMKPDLRPYRWMATQLRIEPGKSVYVGNGSSDELAGARQAGFGHIVHSNVFDRSNGLVEPQEQLRRARQADTTVDTVDDLDDELAAR